MKRLRNAFVTGILVLAPLLATIDILRWIVKTVDNTARGYLPTYVLPWDFPGLGLVFAAVLIVLAGFLAQNYFGKAFVSLFDTIIRHTPFIGGIYGAIKKFLETVFNSKPDQFHGVVLVPFPRTGIFSIGFRTGKPDAKLVGKNTQRLANIFVPCTPNPTSGFYLLVPEDELTPLDLSVQDAFKIVISMGIVTSDDIPGLGRK